MAPPAEISIPTTSLSNPSAGSSEKPYTLYNITLRLPLRSFVVQKRYSDFSTLNASLCSLVGAPPPQPLPTKHWFRSTVVDADLTETRRQGLEAYLRAIAESPDRRWRDTPVWRAFLNLPSTGGGGGGFTGSIASSSGISAQAGGAAAGGSRGVQTIVNLAAQARDPSAWLELHRQARQALHDARLHLARRDAAAASGSGGGGGIGAFPGDAAAVATMLPQQALEAGAAAKKSLVRAGTLLAALGDGLRALEAEQQREQSQGAGGGKRKVLLGDGEVRRRKDLLAAAKVEREGLEKLSASLAAAGSGRGRDGDEKLAGSSGGADRAALLGRPGGGGGGPRTGGRVIGGPPPPETERTVELDNGGVLQLQKQMMQEQDDEVESLARVIRRQKEMGLAIHDEVERHKDMLDLLDEDVSRVQAKVAVAKNRAKKIN